MNRTQRAKSTLPNRRAPRGIKGADCTHAQAHPENSTRFHWEVGPERDSGLVAVSL